MATPWRAIAPREGHARSPPGARCGGDRGSRPSRHRPAVRDAEPAHVRVRVPGRRPGPLSRGRGARRGGGRPPAHAHAAGRCRDLAPADDPGRPVRPAAHAVPRLPADARRGARVRLVDRVPGAPGCRDPGRAEPQRERGRAVPRHRAGVARAARRCEGPDVHVRQVPGRRLRRDRPGLPGRGPHHAGGARNRGRAGRRLSRRHRRLRRHRAGDGVHVPAVDAAGRGGGARSTGRR